MRNTFLLASLVFFGASTDARAQPEAAMVAESAGPKTGPERGTFLFIRTKPDGARVLIDGKQVGLSDDLFAVDPGVRRIIVELEGHDRNGRDVTVRVGRIERVKLDLTKRRDLRSQVSASTGAPGPEAALIQSLAFVPTREHLLLDFEGESRDTFIDLDTGKLTTGLPDADNDAREAYIKRTGIDAGAYEQDGSAGLGCFHMAASRIGKPFDQVTPLDVLDALVHGDLSASDTALAYDDSAFHFQTYFFLTRERTIGILEMLGPVTEKPNRGMRVRYKTVCRVLSKPGSKDAHFVPWRLTDEVINAAVAAQKVAWKKRSLPNVDLLNEEPDSRLKAFLDLASGEMLAFKPEKGSTTAADATDLEKRGVYFSASAGDLCFSGRAMDNAPNGAIICLRGARAVLWSAGGYQEVQPEIIRLPRKGTWWFAGVEDPPQGSDWDPYAYGQREERIERRSQGVLCAHRRTFPKSPSK